MSLEDLKQVTNNDVQVFTLEGLRTEAKVVRVIDGDTLDLAFYHGDRLVRFTCRMLGYNTPELTQRNPSRRALLARDFLAHICMGEDPDTFDDSRQVWTKSVLQRRLNQSRNLVYAVFDRFGKFGRALVTLRTSPRGRSINDLVGRRFGEQ